MDDTISRQDAIDALEAKKDKSAKGDIGCFYNTIIQNNIDALKGLPSAQPEIKTDWNTISRQAAIDAVSDACFELRGVFGRCEDALKALPSTQPEPKTGHWINKHERTTNTWECSNCGYRVNLMDGGIYKFCSACGEKKDGEYG